jgi:hypothetical protein
VRGSALGSIPGLSCRWHSGIRARRTRGGEIEVGSGSVENLVGIGLTRLCARYQLAAQTNTYLVPFRISSMKHRSASKLERSTGVIGMDWRRSGAKTGIDAPAARFDLRRRLRMLVTRFVALLSLQTQPMLRWAARGRHGSGDTCRSRPTQVSHTYKLDHFEFRSHRLSRVL